MAYLPLLVFLSTLFAGLASQFAFAAPASLPLCGSVKGFAGELNHEFSLVPNVEVDWRRGEAIVLAVRPIPFNPSDPSARAPAFIDARYSIGNESFRFTSNPDGLLTINNPIPMGTALDICVRNARLDGATPFVLYSYVSNKPHCFIDLSPSKSFLGPVPGSANGNPPSIYFSSTPPLGVSSSARTSSAFKFGVTTGVPVSVWYALSSADMAAGRGRFLQIGSEVTWPRPSPLYIEVRPSFQGTQPAMMRAVIEWRLLDGPDDNSNWGNTVNNNPVNNGGANNNAHNTNPINPPVIVARDDDDEEEEEEQRGGKGSPKPPAATSRAISLVAKGLRISGYVMLFGFLYFMIGSVINYKIRSIHSFPEYIPHHELVGSALVLAGSAARTVKNKASRSRGGYSGVNSAEAEDA